MMTIFVVGLNAPSLPLLPLFTCACAASRASSKSAKMWRRVFMESLLFLVGFVVEGISSIRSFTWFG